MNADSERGLGENSTPLSSLPYRVLVPLTNSDEAKIMLPLAEMIVSARQGHLIVLHITATHEGESLTEGTSHSMKFREELNSIMNDILSIMPQSRTLVRSGDEIWDGIWDTVQSERINLLLLGWCIPSGFSEQVLEETAVSEFVDPLLDDPPCDIVAVRATHAVMGVRGWSAVNDILLPSRGGKNAGLALRVANALAQNVKASITLFHVTRQETRRDEEVFVDEFSPVLRGLENITSSVVKKGEIAPAIVEEAKKYDVIVLGAPSRDVNRDSWSGPILDAVVTQAEATLIVVKEGRSVGYSSMEIDEPLSVQIDRPLAVVVDKWFAENTYHSREFSELNQLVALKRDQNISISLGLPALNEAETVGNVIQTIKTELMDNVPLLDEIVLIDSGSIDYTREIALDLGIPVFLHREILPQYGSYQGKGEALWKSLYVLSGDIVAWIDTDIKNIHPRFVYGVIGPLLRNPQIQYVKGFYRRPLRQGNKMVAGGGGRVTELTARPLFNLFYPELSGLIQPLSGEYAGRRSSLEQLPFFTGYGVETGLLIDILEKFGISAIAQTDLLQRIHHNQPLPSLSKMSFTIMQVILRRLEQYRRIDLLDEANLTMNLVRYGGSNYFLEPEEIREGERPAMVELPEYRNLRK